MRPENPSHALRRSADDPEAFAGFYDAHAASVLAYLARRVYDAEAALDLTAEVFARAFEARARFRGSTDAQAAAWLYTIAKRELARYFKKGRTQLKAVSRLGMQVPALDASQQAEIEAIADLEALRGSMRVALEQLSEAHRDALQLRIVEELPYADVARRLGVSEEAARTRVSRGLKSLANTLNVNSLAI